MFVRKASSGLTSPLIRSNSVSVVDLPAEPDGKQIDIHFVKEGNVEERTQTALKPEVSRYHLIQLIYLIFQHEKYSVFSLKNERSYLEFTNNMAINQ